MKLRLISLAIVAAAATANFISCSKENTNVTPSPTALDPSGTTLGSIPNLGRVLFYDTHLSVNNSISCASCHKQEYAFADNVAVSPGFENKKGNRNAITIQNLSTSAVLFWDGRDTSLQPMVVMPMLNHVEMGMNNLNDVVTRVSNMPYYNDLFNKAFGTPDVTVNRIEQALAYFLEGIVADQSRFDAFLFNSGTLTALEAQGKSLFFSKYNCNSCHNVENTFSYNFSPSFLNIGLDENPIDKGLGGVNGNSYDNGKFKVPRLRNVALTGPYMHDGRFTTLNDVLEHYSHGIANSANLDERLRNPDGTPKQMNISDNDKTALIAFLNSLTDYTVVTSPDLANPFKK